jgi:hypothetical protein
MWKEGQNRRVKLLPNSWTVCYSVTSMVVSFPSLSLMMCRVCLVDRKRFLL